MLVPGSRALVSPEKPLTTTAIQSATQLQKSEGKYRLQVSVEFNLPLKSP